MRLQMTCGILRKENVLLWILMLILLNVNTNVSQSMLKNKLSDEDRSKLDTILLNQDGDLCDRPLEYAFFGKVETLTNDTEFEELISQPDYSSVGKMCNRFAGLQCEHHWEKPAIVFRCMCHRKYVWDTSRSKCAIRKYRRCTWNREEPDGEKGSIQLNTVPTKYSALKDYSSYLQCQENTYCHVVLKNCVCYNKTKCPDVIDQEELFGIKEKMKSYSQLGFGDERLAKPGAPCQNYASDFFRHEPNFKYTIYDWELIRKFFESPRDRNTVYCDFLNFFDCDYNDQIPKDFEFVFNEDYEEYRESYETYVYERERYASCTCMHGFTRVENECKAHIQTPCTTFYWHRNIWYDIEKKCYDDSRLNRIDQLSCVRYTDIRGTDEEMSVGWCCRERYNSYGGFGRCLREKYEVSYRSRLRLSSFIMGKGIVRLPSNNTSTQPPPNGGRRNLNILHRYVSSIFQYFSKFLMSLVNLELFL